ncbi:type III secretion system protein [Burkholderia cenocepacia]|uniref:type III secretion system protein n=1 Tax=Burkholderia TaxID=32008 RepID=UPI000F5A936F|nr:type III secretion system protein [Burkholderia sp. AcTa6-5]RQU42273.1 type III secretion system protein [Burkholderia cenocepacia]MBP0717765.1 type III secretion system protein [Burkholderia sp. AcTa6-5]RQU95916.1 type III secretion system protein [Burkholderia cenocepacia]RQV23690.1 type III secretion system protein [Burkholderia cenocepacia]RQV88221.1 type III secretion system protein [Burkholderia cenocepacia]
MKDRRVAAFERVLSRRRQRDRKLNAALGGLRGELQALIDALEESRAAVRAHAAGLAAHDGKIDAMLGSVSFRADAYLKLREFRSHAAEQHAMLEARAAQAGQALAAKEAQIGALRTEILRNRARIDIYEKRRDTLVKAIELAIEDAQDEETSESRRPSPAF